MYPLHAHANEGLIVVFVCRHFIWNRLPKEKGQKSKQSTVAQHCNTRKSNTQLVRIERQAVQIGYQWHVPFKNEDWERRDTKVTFREKDQKTNNQPSHNIAMLERATSQ